MASYIPRMLGSFVPSSRLRRAPLAIGLCVLAVLFALEAKTAWYGPFAVPGGAIRAAKALPVGLPELVDHGVPAPDPAHPGVAFATLPAGATVWLPRAKGPALDETPRSHLLFFAACFSPSIFFRPPPVL